MNGTHKWWNELQVGDLVGFSASGMLGAMINLGTWGVPGYGLSHIAIVGEYTKPGVGHPEKLLFESTTTVEAPCYVKGKRINGTQAHQPRYRVAYYPGRVWHYRLAHPLPKEKRDELSQFLLDGLGTPYDTLGAFRARGLTLVERFIFRPSDLNSVFCSEWCAAGWQKIGLIDNEEAQRWSPNKLARYGRRESITPDLRLIKGSN